MTRALLAVALLLLATPCRAQSTSDDIDGDVFAAGKELEMIGPAVAQAVIAIELCGGGNAEPWKKVVAAIDSVTRSASPKTPSGRA
jgi:hypothetical protein